MPDRIVCVESMPRNRQICNNLDQKTLFFYTNGPPFNIDSLHSFCVYFVFILVFNFYVHFVFKISKNRLLVFILIFSMGFCNIEVDFFLK